MDKSLARLLHESLAASPAEVSLPRGKVLEALDREADRQLRAAHRWFTASMLALMIPPQLNSLLSPQHSSWRWVSLGIIALMAVWAAMPSWTPAYRRARALPFQKRFREIAIQRVVTRIAFFFGGIFLLLVMLERGGWEVGTHIEHRGLAYGVTGLSALLCGWLGHLLLPRLARRLDPYWFE